MRLTIDEYSNRFKMSKEMIQSKIRTKKIDYIIEDGITYIIPTNKSEPTKELLPSNIKTKATVAMILSLYKKENTQLKEKILQLETKIDSLIDDKEQMLRDEMQKIEEVYSNKDTQLKNILELINAKLAIESTPTIHEIEPIKEETKIVELKAYLKTLDLDSKKKKSIKKKFITVYGSDIRVLKQNGKFYLDFSKYDYSDLLNS